MPKPDRQTAEILTRTATITRAAPADDGAHRITGRLVPWDTETEIWPGWFERFERGAVRTDEVPPLLFWQHGEPIGRIESLEDRDDGLYVTARISDTERGREAATLVDDGTLTRLSIGFLPVDSDEITRTVDGRDEVLTVRTDAIIREASIVSFPAYADAVITAHRSHPDTPPRKDTTMDPESLAKIREGLATAADLADVNRRLETLSTAQAGPPAVDRRSAGQLIADMVAGDTSTIDLVNKVQDRAYAGTATADVDLNGGLPLPAGIENLVRIVNNANPVAQLFKTAGLPATGMVVPFLRLKSTAVQIDKQAAPGDDLAGPSKVAFEQTSAPIEVHGGWTELDIATVQRFDVPTLDTMLSAMAVELGKQAATRFATKLTATITARAAAAVTVASADSADAWSDVIVDAQLAYLDVGMPLDGLLVDPTTFKALRKIKDGSGRYLMRTWGDGVNQVGQIDGLSGQLGPVRVSLFHGAAAGTAAFYNAAALSSRSNGVVQLQDTNVVNLTGQWSLHQLSAVCDEQPGLILPVTIGAQA